MSLAEVIDRLERQATDAARYEATARVDVLLRAVIEDLRDVDEANGTAPDGTEPDRLIPIDEAAQLLGMKTRWLYDHHDSLPFTHRIGRQLRFSLRGLQRYLTRRR